MGKQRFATGRGDAKGKETRFQGEERTFQRGVLLFLCGFPRENGLRDCAATPVLPCCAPGWPLESVPERPPRNASASAGGFVAGDAKARGQRTAAGRTGTVASRTPTSASAKAAPC